MDVLFYRWGINHRKLIPIKLNSYLITVNSEDVDGVFHYRKVNIWTFVTIGHWVLSVESGHLAHSYPSQWNSFQQGMKNSSRSSKVAHWMWPAARQYVSLDSHPVLVFSEPPAPVLLTSHSWPAMLLSHTNIKYFCDTVFSGSWWRMCFYIRKNVSVFATKWNLCVLPGDLGGLQLRYFYFHHIVQTVLYPHVENYFPLGL